GSRIDAAAQIGAFMDSDRRVLLVVGGPGAGKTLLLRQLEAHLAADVAALPPVPLFIDLLTLDTAQPPTLAKMSAAGLSQAEVLQLQRSRRVVFLVDSFDALAPGRLANLFKANRWAEWDCKVVVACRPLFLSHVAAYEELFVPD
ncbi:unnamed protein product, partial [Phaeothamnion confervicola]